jgi:hypothetical protein
MRRLSLNILIALRRATACAAFFSSTTAVERQDPDFLIGPRNEKKNEKKKVDH